MPFLPPNNSVSPFINEWLLLSTFQDFSFWFATAGMTTVIQSSLSLRITDEFRHPFCTVPDSYSKSQWQRNRGFRRFNETGAHELLGASCKATKSFRQENNRSISEKQQTAKCMYMICDIHWKGLFYTRAWRFLPTYLVPFDEVAYVSRLGFLGGPDLEKCSPTRCICANS